jgi:hypothetical protein
VHVNYSTHPRTEHGLFAISPDPEAIGANGRPRVNFHMLRPVPLFEFEQYTSAVTSVGNVVQQGFMVFLIQAMDDLTASVQRISHVAPTSTPGDQGNKWRVELECRVLNVCAAIRMYEEHVMAELSRKYGKHSEETEEAKRIFSATFDQHLSYRVLYSLRNAVVHGSRSLFGFQMSVGPDVNEEDGNLRVDISIDLVRASFKKTSVNARVRHEVAALAVNPNTLKLCYDVFPAMMNLNTELVPLLEPKLPQALATLAGVINEAAEAGGYAQMSSFNPADFPASWKMSPLPGDVYDFVAAAFR